MTKLVGLVPLLGLLLTGCAANSPPSSFYVLSSLYGSEVGFRPASDGLAVGVGPLELPDHLDRPQIVTRENPNRIDINEFHRWGGELRSEIKRVLAQDLSFRLNSDRVQVYPWPARSAIEYQLRCAVVRMDGVLGRKALVSLRWEIRHGEDGEVIASQLSTRQIPVNAPGYQALVAAQSTALAEIATEIADRLKQIETGNR